ncbi:MAG: tRNA (adenosine(37)-N6)-dimethylallyltransferase MiaA [Candidatus Gracilibacteria bacterium]|nr:tRNA (adenosine(37)-N6)-dimethylallyltransferase MiaA [Candidatus Gracilibacteria bacterium]
MNKNIEIFSKIDNFLKKKSQKDKIIVIYGPTACGKTGVGIEISKYIKSEIISTDSRQIFEYLDIGTGKVTLDESDGIIHHMIDIINPDMEFSVGEFKKEALKIIGKIQKKGKIPILVGGTGLYIDSLIYDFNIPKAPEDKKLRLELEQKALDFGKKYVWDILNEIDPKYAREVHYNNLNYVIRGIEVKKLTGLSKLDFKTEKNLKFDTFFYTPYFGDRLALYNKINLRIKQMFDFGLVNEVKNILKMGYKKTDFGLKTIGYKEVIEYLDEKITLDECVEIVSRHNRNYAKRQLTWFRKYEENNQI